MAFIIYLVVLVVSPLLFGAVHTYAYTLAFTGIFIASLLLVKSNIEKESGTYRFKWIRTSLTPMFLVFLGYLILQMIPLPDFLLVHLSPEAKVVGDMSLPAVSALDPATVKGHWYSLAPYTYPVRMSLIRWIAYGFLFFGLVQTLNTKKRIEIATIAIILLCCFETLYGIIQTYSGSGRIWWFKAAPREVIGTYLNHNHFAGFMEMGVILAIAYAGALADKDESRQPALLRRKSFLKKLPRYFSGEKFFTKRFLIIYAGGIAGLGLILSASRGGIVSAAAAMLAMGLFLFIRKDHRRKGMIILLLFLITAVYALYVGIDYTVGRFRMFDQDFDVRMRYTQGTIELFADYWLAGVGVGNFPFAFPRHQSLEDKNFFISVACNDLVEFIAEAGVLGILLFLAGMTYYVVSTFKVWVTRRDSFTVCLGIAPIVAMISLGIHSYADFNLQMPANFMMLTAVTAIGYSALHLESPRYGDRVMYRYHIWILNKGRILVPIFFLVVILWSGVWTVRHFVAEMYCSTEPNSTLNIEKTPPVENIQKAIALDRGNAECRYKLAWAWMDIRNKDAKQPNSDITTWHERRTAIIPTLEEAIRFNPLRSEYHMRLGWEYSYQTNQPDYRQKWLPAADISMERAAYMTGNGAENPRIHMEFGNYWSYRSRTLYQNSPEQEVAWTKAVWHYSKARELIGGKRLDDEIAAYVKNFYPDPEHLKEIL